MEQKDYTNFQNYGVGVNEEEFLLSLVVWPKDFWFRFWSKASKLGLWWKRPEVAIVRSRYNVPVEWRRRVFEESIPNTSPSQTFYYYFFWEKKKGLNYLGTVLMLIFSLTVFLGITFGALMLITKGEIASFAGIEVTQEVETESLKSSTYTGGNPSVSASPESGMIKYTPSENAPKVSTEIGKVSGRAEEIRRIPVSFSKWNSLSNMREWEKIIAGYALANQVDYEALLIATASHANGTSYDEMMYALRIALDNLLNLKNNHCTDLRKFTQNTKKWIACMEKMYSIRGIDTRSLESSDMAQRVYKSATLGVDRVAPDDIPIYRVDDYFSGSIKAVSELSPKRKERLDEFNQSFQVMPPDPSDKYHYNPSVHLSEEEKFFYSLTREQQQLFNEGRLRKDKEGKIVVLPEPKPNPRYEGKKFSIPKDQSVGPKRRPPVPGRKIKKN